MLFDLVKLDLSQISDEEAAYYLEARSLLETMKQKKNG